MRIKMDLQIGRGASCEKKIHMMKNHIGKEHDRQTIKKDTF